MKYFCPESRTGVEQKIQQNFLHQGSSAHESGGRHTAPFFRPHHLNDVTTHHYFFRPHLFFVRALLLCFQMYYFMSLTLFFSNLGNVCMYIQWFNCIFLMHFKKERKENMCTTPIFSPDHTYISSGNYVFLILLLNCNFQVIVRWDVFRIYNYNILFSWEHNNWLKFA